MIGKLNHRNVTSISFYVQQQEQNRAGVVIKLSDVAWCLSNSGGAHDMLVLINKNTDSIWAEIHCHHRILLHRSEIEKVSQTI